MKKICGFLALAMISGNLFAGIGDVPVQVQFSTNLLQASATVKNSSVMQGWLEAIDIWADVGCTGIVSIVKSNAYTKMTSTIYTNYAFTGNTTIYPRIAVNMTPTGLGTTSNLTRNVLVHDVFIVSAWSNNAATNIGLNVNTRFIYEIP